MGAFALVFIAVCDLAGQWDYKRGTFSSNIEIQKKSNEYDRNVAATLQYLLSEKADPQARELYHKWEQWTKPLQQEVGRLDL